jgi:nickel-dependent lactate racemase
MYRIPFSTNHLDFDLPADMTGTCVTRRSCEAVADVKGAVSNALAHPLNCQLLRQTAKRGDTVCIVFTDITRESPDHLLVPALLAELEIAGVRDQDITLLCGTGLHRPSTAREKIIKLGQAVVDRYRVVDHAASDPSHIEDLGSSETAIPLSVNRIAFEADLVVTTGIVEPHQYAGYSGGPKTLAIGAAGEAMIAYTHGPQMVDHPGTRLGKLQGNLFHQALMEASRRAGLSFILNVVLDELKRPVAVVAGEPEAAFYSLVASASKLSAAPLDRQYDVVVAGVGFPKDLNLYQASRGASQLFFASFCPVKEGGIFIIPASTPEGAGYGVGEQRFLQTMKNAGDMVSLLDKLRRTGYPPGAQRAFIMAKVLQKSQVIIVGSKTPEVVRQVHMIPATDMDEALCLAEGEMGRKDLEVLIVPQSLLTLPVASCSA